MPFSLQHIIIHCCRFCSKLKKYDLLSKSGTAQAYLSRSTLKVGRLGSPTEIGSDAYADFPNVVARRRCYERDASDAMFRRTASLCLRFALCRMRHNSAKRHILGIAHPGGDYEPQIRTWPRSLCNAPTPKFHHPMFTRSEVIVLTKKPTNLLTNKQTPTKTSNVLRYATTLGNKASLVTSTECLRLQYRRIKMDCRSPLSPVTTNAYQ